MSALDLVGEEFPSKTNPELTWTVTKKVARPENFSGGNRSSAYHVRGSDGRIAFMKSVDSSLFLGSESLADKLFACVQQHRAEHSVLEHCRSKSMNRILVPLDHVERLDVFNDVMQPVFGLVFDLAEQDARQAVDSVRQLDFGWAIEVMHSVAVGVSQMHTGNVIHNDLKPSNVLLFSEHSKVGDLGSATCQTLSGMGLGNDYRGDPKYAPPECLYGAERSFDQFQSARAAELYMLGSLGGFLAGFPMMTTLVLSKMRPEHRPLSAENAVGWAGTFEDVLPYWETAFSEAFVELKNSLPPLENGRVINAREEYLGMVESLCAPQPSLRGHAKNRLGHQDRFSVERYVSLLDRLRLKMSISRRAS